MRGSRNANFFLLNAICAELLYKLERFYSFCCRARYLGFVQYSTAPKECIMDFDKLNLIWRFDSTLATMPQLLKKHFLLQKWSKMSQIYNHLYFFAKVKSHSRIHSVLYLLHKKGKCKYLQNENCRERKVCFVVILQYRDILMF